MSFLYFFTFIGLLAEVVPIMERRRSWMKSYLPQYKLISKCRNPGMSDQGNPPYKEKTRIIKWSAVWSSFLSHPRHYIRLTSCSLVAHCPDRISESVPWKLIAQGALLRNGGRFSR